MRKIELRYKRKTAELRDRKLMRLQLTPRREEMLKVLYGYDGPAWVGYQGSVGRGLEEAGLVRRMSYRRWEITLLGRRYVKLKWPWVVEQEGADGEE